MSKKPTDNAEPQEEMTQEQYNQARNKAKKHLEKEIEYLRVEETYQRLTADIEEHKARRLRALAVQHQFLHGAPGMPSEQEKSKQNYDHEIPVETPFKPQPKTKVRTLAKES